MGLSMVNTHIIASKIGALHGVFEKLNGDYPEKTINIFTKCSNLCLPKQGCGIFRGTYVRFLWAPRRNGSTDFDYILITFTANAYK
jgi:hypothetical protein